MANVEYKTQLQDNLWKQRRLDILKRDKNECQMCMSKKDLHVHHKKYIKGRKVWEYEDRYLITVCSKCHEKHHDKPKATKPKVKYNYSQNDQRHQYYNNLKQAERRYGE